MENQKRRKFDWYSAKQRFSIRKYHFGAASILLGLSLAAVLDAQVIKAEEQFMSEREIVVSEAPSAVEEVDNSVETPLVAELVVEEVDNSVETPLVAEPVEKEEGNSVETPLVAGPVSEELTKVAESEAVSDALAGKKQSIIVDIEKQSELSAEQKEAFVAQVGVAQTVAELNNIQSEARATNVRLQLDKRRATPSTTANTQSAFRKVTTDVYTAALSEIKALSNLNDVEKRYYTAEITKLTKGIINRDAAVQTLLEKARKHNELVANNRGTSEDDAIVNSVSPNEVSTVSGNVRLTYGGGINDDANEYHKPLEGVEVYAQWYEKNGFASPIYKTVSQADGSFSIGLADFIGADGKLYQFDADAALPKGEKWRVWSKNPDTTKYSLMYSSGEEQIAPEGIVKDITGGMNQDVAKGRLFNLEIRYAHKISDVWRENAINTPAVTGNGGGVNGSVYWNNNSPSGNQMYGDIISRENKYDLGLPNITVYASYLSDYAVAKLNSEEALNMFVDESSEWTPTVNSDRTSNIRGRKWTRANEEKLRQYILDSITSEGRDKWIAETVKTQTTGDGTFALQFNGTFGFSWNDPGYTGALLGTKKSALVSEENVENTMTGEIRKGTEWMGVVAPAPEYGTWTGDARYGKGELAKAPKHINWDWLMIAPEDIPGVVFTNGYYGDIPKGPSGTSWGPKGLGTNWGVAINDGSDRVTGAGSNDEVWNVNFAAYNDGLKFDIYNYDSFGNFAKPGDTAKASTGGLTPNMGASYKVVWKDEDGKIVSESEVLAVKPDGTLEEVTYVTGADITKTTTYFAELYQLDSDGNLPDYPMLKDSFTVVYRELPVYKVTEGEVGQSITSESPTFDVEHTEEVEARAVPEGATFTLVSGKGDENVEGFTIDSKTGAITWGNPQEDTEVTVEVTYKDGTTATTTAKFIVKKADKEKYTPEYPETNVVPGTPATSTPTLKDVDGNATLTPSGTKFSIDPTFKTPEGYAVTIDETTGVVTVTAPEMLTETTAEQVVVPVVVTYPDATTDVVTATFNLDTDGDGTPDKDDTDDDNDGILDTDEATDGTNPKDSNSVASSIKPIGDQTVEQGKPITDVKVEVEKEPTGAFLKVEGLPDGVTFDPETKTISGTPTAEGESAVKITVLGKDGNPVKGADGNLVTEEFKIIVTRPATPDADKYEPTAKPEEVEKGGTVDLTDNVDPITDEKGNPVNVVVKDVTPEGAIDTNTPGDYTGKVEITYPDGSTEIIDVPVKVVDNTPSKTDADKYEPTAKPEEVEKGGTVDLTDNVDPITDEKGNPVNVVV
ncbi:YPDG domain-containing protein, partial [Streptococcus suis]